MLLKLLHHPQNTIRALLDDPSATWTLPLTGYFLVSFAEGYERLVSARPTWPAAVLILLTAAGALVIGTWAWAGMFGGALHLSARLFRGREGAAKTIRAVGYALFWPGILAASASAAMIALGYRGAELPKGAMALALLQICAGLWGLYTVVAALRARHGFGWMRAVLAYLLLFVVLAVVAVAFLAATGRLS